MSHMVFKPEFEKLVDPHRPVSQIGTGFTFTEGPVWHPKEEFLLFSDIPESVRRRWDQRDGVREVLRPTNMSNGMTFDSRLNLLVCEHATSMLIREHVGGKREIVASHFEGKELNSPNDVCVHSNGTIYFTDPWYGRMPGHGVERPLQLGFQGVYCVVAGEKPQLVARSDLFEMPNGLCLSPDEDKLYVNDTAQALIRAFELQSDGSPVDPEGRVFASGIRSDQEPGVPDGMKCDERGNVWVTGPGGIWVFSCQGEILGKIRVPEFVANLAWGGKEFRNLFICATTSVYSLTTRVRARREPFMKSA